VVAHTVFPKLAFPGQVVVQVSLHTAAAAVTAVYVVRGVEVGSACPQSQVMN